MIQVSPNSQGCRSGRGRGVVVWVEDLLSLCCALSASPHRRTVLRLVKLYDTYCVLTRWERRRGTLDLVFSFPSHLFPLSRPFPRPVPNGDQTGPGRGDPLSSSTFRSEGMGRVRVEGRMASLTTADPRRLAPFVTTGVRVTGKGGDLRDQKAG